MESDAPPIDYKHNVPVVLSQEASGSSATMTPSSSWPQLAPAQLNSPKKPPASGAGASWRDGRGLAAPTPGVGGLSRDSLNEQRDSRLNPDLRKPERMDERLNPDLAMSDRGNSI